jgi:hypothetical protein
MNPQPPVDSIGRSIRSQSALVGLMIGLGLGALCAEVWLWRNSSLSDIYGALALASVVYLAFAVPRNVRAVLQRGGKQGVRARTVARTVVGNAIVGAGVTAVPLILFFLFQIDGGSYSSRAALVGSAGVLGGLFALYLRKLFSNERPASNGN